MTYASDSLQWLPNPNMENLGRFVAILLALATILSLTMAILSGINHDPKGGKGPPDEYQHRGAARYYVDHWLPPQVGDPATLGSYSRGHGLSYINDPDPVYPLAGKFAALLSPFITNLDLGFRLFNVTLLGILAGLCFLRPPSWPLFVPLLISPQVWYIFSYFNGDALPLFLSVLIAYQVAYPDSLLNRYLDSPGVVRGLGGVFLCGLLVALLLLSKKNYFVLLAMLPAVMAISRLGLLSGALLAISAMGGAAIQLGWLTISQDVFPWLAGIAALAVLLAIFLPASSRAARGRIVLKLAALVLVAGTIAHSRSILDSVVYGSYMQKQAAVIELQEQKAQSGFKPSQVYAPKKTPQSWYDIYYGLDLRARGTPLAELFSPPWDWHIKSFQSFAGQYGWLNISGPTAYYVALGMGYGLLLAIYAAAVARSGDKQTWAILGVITFFSALTIAISVHHSWHNDFQAQGRYLFPILPMLGLGLYSVRRCAYRGITTSLLAICFALSAWSFIFIGLSQIPRSF
jgi:hypothetical protein